MSVMSLKKGGKTKKHPLLAKLVTGSENSVPCAFCNRVVDDEIIYGKLYAIGDIQCHYFCVLLSCCLVQKGKDEEGLFGFLYPDIIAELERSKKHKCSYCGKDGATLGCTVSQCRKQFHLPCGRERNAVSLFYGNFKSFCERHAPRQRVNDEIMAKAQPRKAAYRKLKTKSAKANKILDISDSGIENSLCNENTCNENALSKENLCIEEEKKQEPESVCVICYECVDGFPTLNTFWPPCCARDAWFHRSCLQRMALSAGMHYLKCPLCNQKEAFYEAVLSQGYYVPDRDAAWELEQNAFAEIYERPVICSATKCCCLMGRDYDAETGLWDIRLCVLCGSSGVHIQCYLNSEAERKDNCNNGESCGENIENSNGNGEEKFGNGNGKENIENNNGNSGENLRYVCPTCFPVAPEDLDKLVINTDTGRVVSSDYQVRGRPMPSRMSLRRTKQRALRHLSASASDSRQGITPVIAQQQNNQDTSIPESNLGQPEKPINLIEPTLLQNVENKLLSPLKLLEQGLRERIPNAEDVKFEIDTNELINKMRERFTKPKPLVEKKKIVNDILESVLESIHKDKMKTKESFEGWSSTEKKEVTEETVTDNQPPEEKQEDSTPTEGEKELIEVFETCNDNIITIGESFENCEENIYNNKQDDTVQDENETKQTNRKTEESSINKSPELVVEDPHFESPKKKPILVQNSSMEISHENNVSIDLVSNIENSTPKKVKRDIPTMFKLSSPDGLLKDGLIDIESFKSRYLTEVDRDYKNNNSEKNVQKATKRKLEMHIDRKIKRRRKNLPKKDRLKFKWKTPVKKFMLSPNERRLVQTSIQSFFEAK